MNREQIPSGLRQVEKAFDELCMLYNFNHGLLPSRHHEALSQLPSLIAAVEAWGGVDEVGIRKRLARMFIHEVTPLTEDEDINYVCKLVFDALSPYLRPPPNIDSLVEGVRKLAGKGTMGCYIEREEVIALIRKWAAGSSS